MFKGFANVWSIVALASAIAPNRPHPVTLAGERVVLFRDSTGKIAALHDRCPHRGVALSLGKVNEGQLECPFHGWRFNASGANCHVPWNPDARRENLGATALPVRELAGLIWLYSGFAPPDEPVVPETLQRADVVLCAQAAVWQVHWTRVMENMLDMPHLPFVHGRSIGRGLIRFLGGRMDTGWQPEPFGAHISNEIIGKPNAGGLNYLFPNTMELLIDPPGRVFRLMAVCQPEAEGHTRLTLFTIRNFAKSRLFNPLFRYANARIAAEDKAIVESSLPAQVPPAGEEKSVRTDKPTLAFRKIYFDQLAHSSAASPTVANLHSSPTN